MSKALLDVSPEQLRSVCKSDEQYQHWMQVREGQIWQEETEGQAWMPSTLADVKADIRKWKAKRIGNTVYTVPEEK